jgi:hypothetical protein
MRALLVLMWLASIGHAAPADVGIGLGLIQPVVLHGFNAELDIHTASWSFDYSHGASLDLDGGLVVGWAHDQHLAYHLPYSTGFGIGYRVTSSFDVRLEPKLHAWQVYYDGQPEDAAHRVTSYKTVTLGVGAYYRWQPFSGRHDWSRGLSVTTSLRVWPRVYDTLGSPTYMNTVTGRNERLSPAEIGFANTPILANVTLGYTFDWPRT